jgi:hypothetical protein
MPSFVLNLNMPADDQTILKKRTALPQDNAHEHYLYEPWRCGRCHKRNVGYRPLGPRLLYLSLLFLGLPLLFIPCRKLCRDCGHTWPA